MTANLTKKGYLQTRTKLAGLQHRLEEIEKRTDLAPAHHAAVIQSYREMIRQYLREIKLYEEKHPSVVQ
jgi:hypothetical protein